MFLIRIFTITYLYIIID